MWFNTFRPLLRGLGAGFHGDQPNVALHTDVASPVATDPTWSKLAKAAKAELGGLGTPLWHDLIRTLRPDLILMSVAKAWLAALEFERVEEWRDVHELTARRVRPYRVQACRIRVAEDHTALLVWGRAANTPFGSVSTLDKQAIGGVVRAAMDV